MYYAEDLVGLLNEIFALLTKYFLNSKSSRDILISKIKDTNLFVKLIQTPLSCYVMNKSINRNIGTIEDAVSNNINPKKKLLEDQQNYKGLVFNNDEKIYLYAENVYYMFYTMSCKFDYKVGSEMLEMFEMQAWIVMESFLCKCRKFIHMCDLMRFVKRKLSKG